MGTVAARTPRRAVRHLLAATAALATALWGTPPTLAAPPRHLDEPGPRDLDEPRPRDLDEPRPRDLDEPGPRDLDEPRPRDPNDLPPLPDPEGQPAHQALRRDVNHTSAASRRSRVVVTAAPAYASFRLPFLGRPQVPVRGAGVIVAAQVALWRPLGLRLTTSHTMHPVEAAYARDDDEIVQTAGAGLVQATQAGLSATYTLDLGRVVTTLDAGVGGLWMRSPEAVQDGQLGGSCLPQGMCDTGLSCSAENVCRVGFTPDIHGGFSVDVLLGNRFALGGELRYFALFTAPMVYPVYLLAALRASLRF
jgi:hypothetical protein